ncbi:MAG: phosphate signaling complex protein PhoU [Oligoflexia bacterium]|nr:phosphate signaling complex protein PhoU [Oligoflexia bacterium]
MNSDNIGTEKIRDEIINMSTLVEQMLKECLSDESKFEDIVILENRVNKFHSMIDDICFKFIALKRPMARDLRMALSAIKINTDLERIADLALNIKRAKMLLERSSSNSLKQISFEVALMVKNAIDAFIQNDICLATEVIKHDRVVNELNKHIIQTYTCLDNQNHESNIELNFGEAYNIVLISSKLERIGDHTTNIAEDVIFLESGKDVRHQQYSAVVDHNRPKSEF